VPLGERRDPARVPEPTEHLRPGAADLDDQLRPALTIGQPEPDIAERGTGLLLVRERGDDSVFSRSAAPTRHQAIHGLPSRRLVGGSMLIGTRTIHREALR